MRLHVDVLGPENLPGPADGQGLRLVGEFAAAIIAVVGIALGVLVGKNGTGGGHDGFRSEIFRGDELQLVALARKLARNDGPDLGIRL